MDKKESNINWFILCGVIWCLIHIIIELCQNNLPGATFHLVCAASIMILDYLRKVRSDIQEIKENLLEKINKLENSNKDSINQLSSEELRKEIQKLKTEILTYIK